MVQMVGSAGGDGDWGHAITTDSTITFTITLMYHDAPRHHHHHRHRHHLHHHQMVASVGSSNGGSSASAGGGGVTTMSTPIHQHVAPCPLTGPTPHPSTCCHQHEPHSHRTTTTTINTTTHPLVLASSSFAIMSHGVGGDGGGDESGKGVARIGAAMW